MTFDFRTLVTDRTQQDVEYVRQLVDKLVTGTATESEKAEWNSFTLKGVYNYTDLNRVIAAMEDLKVRLEECGYVVPGYQRIKIARTNPSRLPEGATKLEYIASTGTQYVDTLFKPNQNTKLVLDVAFLGSAGTNVAGVRNVSTDTTNRFGIISFGSASKMGAFFRDSSIQSIAFDNNRHLYDLSKSGLVVDGASYGGENSGSFTCIYSLTLFAWNNGPEGAAANSSRIYSCKIYDGGTLSRDFIPCKLADGSVGLWDDVEGKFYGNAGTGAFVAGPATEIVELEYIQSSGTQYVDTGFKNNQDTRVIMDVQLTGVPTENVWLFEGRNGVGSAVASKGIFFYATASKLWTTDYGGNSSRLDFSGIAATDRFAVDYNKNVCTINGQSKTHTAKTFQSNYSLYLLADNRGGLLGTTPTSAKLYSCQIYDNGLLVRDYIPAKTIEGEVGLYDRVFKEFYRNAGTGAFVAGPKMVHEDYTELEYIESTETQYIGTGFVPNQNSRMKIKYQTSQTSSGGVAVACEKWKSKAFGLWVNAAGFGANIYSNAVLYGEDPIEIDFNKNQLLKNGKLLWTSTAATFECPVDLTLFALHASSSMSEYVSAKLYSCQIYDNSTEVRIYIPKMHPSGVVGLWDSVNERFYASATTTDFMAGPEVVKAPGNSQTYLVRAGNEYDKELDPYLWYEGESPTVSQMEQYIGNVTALKGVLKLMRTAPKVPSDMENLTVDEANHIEIILLTVDQMLTNMILTVDTSWATGTAYTGIYAKEAN